MEQRYQGLVCASCACVIERPEIAAQHADVGVVVVALEGIARIKEQSGAHTLIVAERSEFYTQPCVCCHSWTFGYRARLIGVIGHEDDGPMLRFASYVQAQEWAPQAQGDFSYLSAGNNHLTYCRDRNASVASSTYIEWSSDIAY